MEAFFSFVPGMAFFTSSRGIRTPLELRGISAERARIPTRRGKPPVPRSTRRR